MDPVRTPSGFTYERAWLEDLLKKNGGLDPVTGEELAVADCARDDALRAKAEALVNEQADFGEEA
jgi:hypothetical protein